MNDGFLFKFKLVKGVKLMNDNILNTIDQLDIIQMESQLSIYDAMGMQLIKEYFMVESGIFQEATTVDPDTIPNLPMREDTPLNRKGRIPTLTKIADWFGRMVTKIRTYFIRKRTSELLTKIRNSPRYENDELDVIIVKPKWYQDNVLKMVNQLLKYSKEWLGIDDLHLENLTKSGNKFTRAMNDVNRFKTELTDAWEEIKPLAAVNNVLTRDVVKRYDASYMMTATDQDFTKDVDTLLLHIELCNKNMQDCLDLAFKSIKPVKQTIKKIMDVDLNARMGLKKLQEQYVKFITDLTRSYLIAAQIQVKIVDWIWKTMGADHRPDETNKGVIA